MPPEAGHLGRDGLGKILLTDEGPGVCSPRKSIHLPLAAELEKYERGSSGGESARRSQALR